MSTRIQKHKKKKGKKQPPSPVLFNTLVVPEWKLSGLCSFRDSWQRAWSPSSSRALCLSLSLGLLLLGMLSCSTAAGSRSTISLEFDLLQRDMRAEHGVSQAGSVWFSMFALAQPTRIGGWPSWQSWGAGRFRLRFHPGAGEQFFSYSETFQGARVRLAAVRG